jgi:predicted transcriptional regulator
VQYALAKTLGRNYSNVHGDIARLIALGLVERDSDGVRAPFDELEIHVPLLTETA